MEEKVYQRGKQSLEFLKEVYLVESASIVGTKEGQGPLSDLFDMIGSDDMFGCDNWEDAESSLQKDAVYTVLRKAAVPPEDIRYLFAGDLLGQSIASSFGLKNYQIPLFGLYGACSTCGESISLGSMAVSAGFADQVVCVTSSHFASAEKEFRFPLGYGNQRPLSASWTVTGSGAFLLSAKKNGADKEGRGGRARAKIAGITTGKIVDFGVKDSMNMGACMAPAAADTIYQNLMDFNRQPNDYDRIITGDLGYVGQTALIDLLKEQGFDISKQHMDCGIEIFDRETQDTHAGGSGCGCAAVTLSAYVLKKVEEGIWKRVLFVPTGALLGKTSYNEGQPVPGIAHGIVLESLMAE
ncbi:MAG: stage V sporulation protein AD [Clostridiales bacterium]|nr:stage V sporulation protein AD [Clostridiales bacterium]